MIKSAEASFEHVELLSTAPKYEVVTDPEKITVGDVTVVSFDETSKGFSRNFISKATGRKHIVPDRFGETPEPGKNYYVRISRDTNPGVFGGVLISEVLEKTPGTVMEETLEEKLAYTRLSHFYNIKKEILNNTDFDSALKEEIADRWPVPPSSEGDLVIVDAGVNDDGTLNPDVYGVFYTHTSLIDGQQTMFRLSDLGLTQEETERPVTKNPVARDETLVNIPPLETLPGGRNMRVLDIEIEKRNSEGPLVPSKERFRYFTLDENTLQTVYRIASAYGRRSPLFLEGDTAVSKTSSVEFFASQIGAEVRRINLSGQTDTSELIGKFIPNDGTTRVAFEKHISGWNSASEDERNEALSNLKERSQEILRQAAGEHRILTKEENVEVARLEGYAISDTQWIWQDGILPQAMKKGQIVILDEATLAEPQILERINSALENPPSVVLTENGGVKIGPGGEFEVADGFWVVGTGNPAGYAGRTALSDAFARRFVDYYRVPNPEEKHFKQMLELMVYGKQPEVTISGIKYLDSTIVETEFAELAKQPEIDIFINDLSAFHMDMVRMSNPKTRTIGAERHRTGGKYIYTRDTLIGALTYIAKERILDVMETMRQGIPVYVDDFRMKAGRSVERFYIDPGHPDDRPKIRDAMNKYSGKWLSSEL